VPNGTCVARTSSPATSAGPSMSRLTALTPAQSIEKPLHRVSVVAREIGRFGRSSNGEGQLDHRNACLPSNELGRARILVRRVDYEADVLSRNLLDDTGQMRRTGLDPGLGLDRRGILDLQPFEQIHRMVMLGGNGDVAKRCGLFLQLLGHLGKTPDEGLRILRIDVPVVRVERNEQLRELRGDLQNVARV